MTYLWWAALFIGGYVASIYTWEKLHVLAIGAENKALDLRERARAIEKAVRGN